MRQRLVLTVISLVLLIGCSTSDKKWIVERSSTYIYKEFITPYENFEISPNGLKLIGEKQILPAGHLNITCYFSLESDQFYADFYVNVPQNIPNDIRFINRDAITRIECVSDGVKQDATYLRGDKQFAQHVDWFLLNYRDADDKSITICFDFDEPCYDHLPKIAQKNKAAFTRHFTQFISSDTTRNLIRRFPFVSLNRKMYYDLYNKGILKRNDIIWTNYFLKNQMRYQQIDKFKLKEMFDSNR